MTCSTFGSFSYNFHLICYRPNRGERNQHRHPKWQRDGNQQHGVMLVLRRYTVLASVVCWAAHHPPAPLTSLITWIRAVNRLLGGGQPRRQQPGLPLNSTMQGKDILKMRVPVTTLRNMNLIIDEILFLTQLLASYLKVFICICLKVFVCNFLKVIVC